MGENPFSKPICDDSRKKRKDVDVTDKAEKKGGCFFGRLGRGGIEHLFNLICKLGRKRTKSPARDLSRLEGPLAGGALEDETTKIRGGVGKGQQNRGGSFF